MAVGYIVSLAPASAQASGDARGSIPRAVHHHTTSAIEQFRPEPMPNRAMR